MTYMQREIGRMMAASLERQQNIDLTRLGFSVVYPE
jgi:hypothetical protein